MNYLFWLLALSLTLPACAQKAKPHKNKAMAASRPASFAKQQAPVLVVQRTPCHGTCPVYTATIFADGRVEYVGERFVNLLGKHTLSLPVATINELLAEAKRIDFAKLQDQYSGTTFDLPTVIVTVQPVGQPAKTVRAQENLPASLEAYTSLLAKQLDPLANGLTDK